MEDEEIIPFIKEDCSWYDLPEQIKTKFGNVRYNYERCIVSYSISNQLWYHKNLSGAYSKARNAYYEDLLEYSKINLMLYPYHLSEIYVTGMRITPFSYYSEMISDLLSKEKAYDILPNFVAADCLRLLGIGRNEYIDLIRDARPNKRSKCWKLPMQPVDPIYFESWWKVHAGFVTVDDIKSCSKSEKALIDNLIDNGCMEANKLPASILIRLYKKGLLYFDIPIRDDDYFEIQPLEKFVMNRLQGDYMEVILYKVFIAIDEGTSVSELASLLEIDISLIKRAVSLYCRLKFAKKKRSSWLVPASYPKNKSLSSGIANKLTFAKREKVAMRHQSESRHFHSSTGLKRIGILFDSTLTAFLMMGNLSANLRNHAVTMFEIGKLSDENMEKFLYELGNLNIIEGDAEGFMLHAVTLKHSIETLRGYKHTKSQIEGITFGIDLLRCESLQNLNMREITRFLNRSYHALLSIVPFHFSSLPSIPSDLCYFGPPNCHFLTPWFKFFIYYNSGSGPPSLLLPRGYNLKKLPTCFESYKSFSTNMWENEAIVVNSSNLYSVLQESLTQSPVFLQAVCKEKCSATHMEAHKHFMYCSFFQIHDSVFSIYPILSKLRTLLNFEDFVGYFTFLKSSHTKENFNVNGFSRDTVTNDHTDLILFDVTFGLPLFDKELNSACLEQIISSHMFSSEGLVCFSHPLIVITFLTCAVYVKTIAKKHFMRLSC